MLRDTATEGGNEHHGPSPFFPGVPDRPEDRSYTFDSPPEGATWEERIMLSEIPLPVTTKMEEIRELCRMLFNPKPNDDLIGKALTLNPRLKHLDHKYLSRLGNAAQAALRQFPTEPQDVVYGPGGRVEGRMVNGKFVEDPRITEARKRTLPDSGKQA